MEVVRKVENLLKELEVLPCCRRCLLGGKGWMGYTLRIRFPPSKTPGTPSVLFFQATLPLKPATIALEIGHRQLSRRRYFEEPPETMKEGPTGDS